MNAYERIFGNPASSATGVTQAPLPCTLQSLRLETGPRKSSRDASGWEHPNKMAGSPTGHSIMKPGGTHSGTPVSPQPCVTWGLRK